MDRRPQSHTGVAAAGSASPPPASHVSPAPPLRATESSEALRSDSSVGPLGPRPARKRRRQGPLAAATAVFIALLIVVALFPVRSFLTEPREILTSTPSDYTGLTVPLSLPARG